METNAFGETIYRETCPSCGEAVVFAIYEPGAEVPEDWEMAACDACGAEFTWEQVKRERGEDT